MDDFQGDLAVSMFLPFEFGVTSKVAFGANNLWMGWSAAPDVLILGRAVALNTLMFGKWFALTPRGVDFARIFK